MDIPDTLKQPHSNFTGEMKEYFIFSPVVSMIGLLLFIIGIVLTLMTGDIEFLAILHLLAFFIFMIDGSVQLNVQLREYGKAPANIFTILAIGSILVFMLCGILINSLELKIVYQLLTLITTTVYLNLLISISSYKLDRDTLLIKQDPSTNSSKVYVFTEETYIPIVEENSLEKAK